MADISKCTGEGCKMKLFCYRVIVEPNIYRQQYDKYPGMEGKPCIYFIKYKKPLHEKDNQV